MDRFNGIFPWRKKRLSLRKPFVVATSSLIIGSIFLLAVWLYFHPSSPSLGSALSVLADFVPMTIALVGIVMSYKTPKKENHLRTTLIMVFCGIVGMGILSWTRIRSEATHRAEMINLNQKMDHVGDQNTKLGNFLLSERATGKLSEADRRRGIEEVLRNRYILSNNPIDSEILAGLKMPPEEWMNEQLRQMKESWTFKNVQKLIPQEISLQTSSEGKKAHVEFSFFKLDMSDGPETVKFDPIIDGTISFSVSAMVVGDIPADNLQIWIRECTSCEWISPNPPGFSPSDADHQFDKATQITELLPNVPSQRWDFTIKVPRYPQTEVVGIACYYACKNCSPVDWKKPQTLWITRNIGIQPKLLFPSIVYTPEPVKQ